MPAPNSFRWLMLAATLSQAAPATGQVVAAAQAVAQLEALTAELRAQQTEASARFYDGAAYLRQLFQQAAVHPRAMQYAAPWGDNIVFLNWNSAEAFYKVHLQALGTSLALARNGRPVSVSDLAYLTGGVQRWRQEEELLDADLTRSAELYALQARKLGEGMVLGDRIRALPTAARAQAEAQAAQLAAEAAALKTQAVAAARAAIERSKQRLFSPLDAQDRIALSAPEPEADCEPGAIDPGNSERSDIVDTNAAFDALERSLQADLEASDGR